MTLQELSDRVDELYLAFQAIVPGPLDFDAILAKGRAHLEWWAAVLNRTEAYNYWLAAEGWDANNSLFGFDEERTTRHIGPKPERPKSWVARMDTGVMALEQSGPPVIDEYPYRKKKAVEQGKIVFGPVIRYEGAKKARLIGIGSNVSTVPEGTKAVCPEDGIEYVVKNVGGLFGTTLLWVSE